MSAAREPTPAEAMVVRLTFFGDLYATSMQQQDRSLADLLYRIRTTFAQSKAKLPLVKMATFGGIRTMKNSLRTDENLTSITGVEADYDDGRVSFDDAIAVLREAGVRSIAYTSPSHTADKPRWRILCPLSQPYKPDQRDAFMGRLNGLFHGIFAAESWTHSQSYYLGTLEDNAALHRAVLVEGEPIDLMPALDDGWIGRPGAKDGSANERGTERPISHAAFGPASNERYEGYRRTVLDGLRRNAVDGQKHARLRAAAITLGKVSSAAGFDDDDTVQRLLDALPDSVKDWRQAKNTAIWGLGKGRDNPAPLEDRPNPNPKSAGATSRPEGATEAREKPGNGHYDPSPDGNHTEAEAPPPFNEAEGTTDPDFGDPRPDPDVDEILLTEHGVAEAFTERHKDHLRYCHDAGKWYLWTGTHWQLNKTKLGFSWARRLIAELNRGTKFKTKAITGKAAFAAAVERFAQADEAHAVTADNWDQDLFVLGTPGGTVDLRTGLLRPARREDYITQLAAVAPAATVDCSRWLTFLQEATNNDDGLIRFLQQWCGYCLTGDVSEHALLFAYGSGGNGKSVFLNTVAGIMGAYTKVAPMETFVSSGNDHHPTDLAMLRGARLVSVSETEEGRQWAETRIKQLTGGDKISARFMRQDFFEYQPRFKLTIIGNHKPVLRNVDDAARRRFNLAAFIFKPLVVDKNLEKRLCAEWPGILRWMIDGCLDWQENGLVRPDVVLDATASYFEEQDIVHQWVEQCCVMGGRQWDTKATLFKSWSDYALANGEKPGTSKWFTQTLIKLGCEPVKHTPGLNGQRGFKGISVKLTTPPSYHETD